MGNSAGDSVDDEVSADDLFTDVVTTCCGDEEASGSEVSACARVTPDDDAPVLAELSVEHQNALLGDATAAAPAVTVEPDYRTADDRSSILVFTAVGESLDAFDAALASDSTVRDPSLVAAAPDARAYRVRYAPETVRFTPTLADLGALLFDERSVERRWSYHVRFPSSDAFAAFRNFCSTNGATLTLSRLSRAGPAAEDGGHGLTPRQWETLSIAHEMGYFEVPRDTTQEELASRLEVSPSAVSQRIRRATNQLLASTLESPHVGSQL